jgi:hypothetical protein
LKRWGKGEGAGGFKTELRMESKEEEDGDPCLEGTNRELWSLKKVKDLVGGQRGVGSMKESNGARK